MPQFDQAVMSYVENDSPLLVTLLTERAIRNGARAALAWAGIDLAQTNLKPRLATLPMNVLILASTDDPIAPFKHFESLSHGNVMVVKIEGRKPSRHGGDRLCRVGQRLSVAVGWSRSIRPGPRKKPQGFHGSRRPLVERHPKENPSGHRFRPPPHLCGRFPLSKRGRGHARSAADDELRTRGLGHGMAALFQPSYIRKVQDEPSAGTWRTQKTLAGRRDPGSASDAVLRQGIRCDLFTICGVSQASSGPNKRTHSTNGINEGEL